MDTEPKYHDQSEFHVPVELQRLKAHEQATIQARRQAKVTDDPVPPWGGIAYDRERHGR